MLNILGRNERKLGPQVLRLKFYARTCKRHCLGWKLWYEILRWKLLAEKAKACNDGQKALTPRLSTVNKFSYGKAG